jgi:hypothetical protein
LNGIIHRAAVIWQGIKHADHAPMSRDLMAVLEQDVSSRNGHVNLR